MTIQSSTQGARGCLITIEGGEGGGKSTQTKALVARLTAAGVPSIATREPGGSEVAEFIREALLSGVFEGLGAEAEALLFAAARIDHLDTTITPALSEGLWVVSDRFIDSTRAYQGALGNVDAAFLRSLERIVLAGANPDLTLILDVPAHTGLERAARRRDPTAPQDRFEKQTFEYHHALRQAFLTIAAREPGRCVIVDATQTAADVEQAIWDAIVHRIDLRTRPDAIGSSTA